MQTPQVVLLAAFSRHLARCYPLSYRPPLLCLFCSTGTSSQQWTSSVISLHMQMLRKEDARERDRSKHDPIHTRGTAGRGALHSANESCKGACNSWWAGYPFGWQAGNLPHPANPHNGTRGEPCQETIALLHSHKEERQLC